MEEQMTTPVPPALNARRSPLLLLPAAALVLMLSGCAFGFSPDGPPDAPVPATTDNSGEEDPGESGSEDPDTDSDSDLPRRADFEAEVDKQFTCNGGELDIADVGVVVEVVDSCSRVTVSGDGLVVLTADVEELVVTGFANVAFVTSVDTVTVTGDAATVLWESGSPTVDDRGVGSVLLSEEAAR